MLICVFIRVIYMWEVHILWTLVTGDDRSRFLHNQSTADFQSLREGEVKYLVSVVFMDHLIKLYMLMDVDVLHTGLWHSLCDSYWKDHWSSNCMVHGMVIIFRTATYDFLCLCGCGAVHSVHILTYLCRKDQSSWWYLRTCDITYYNFLTSIRQFLF